MFYKRRINILELLKKKSLILLGPRQTGKSTLVKSTFPNAVYLNLAASDIYRELSSKPELIRQKFENIKTMSSPAQLIIDEAQKIPEIFDEIQLVLDSNKNARVILTGSSARKLKRTGINLLPGRIWSMQLFPLVYPETGNGRITDRLTKGSLPGIIDSEDYKQELKNYVGLYLDEEVRSEGLVRGVGNFSRFLTVAALTNAQQVNFSNISNDTGIKINTVRSYYQILEDTLIGSFLPSFKGTIKRKPVSTPKFYFFDIGVVNSLLNRFDVSEESELFGSALEHLIYSELKAYISYSNIDKELTYWRTHSKFEVDFVIGNEIGIEVKAKKRISEKDEKGLKSLAEEAPLKKKIIVCNESQKRKSDNGIEIFPIEEFLESLWSGEIF